MRVVFMGSAGIAVPTLDMLLSSGHEVAGVITQPDRPGGRRLKETACPLKEFAATRGISVLSPEKIGEVDSLAALRVLSPDLFVVVAYGQYIPSSVLALAPCGGINLHPSLLPKYRGASPIQWAVANGDTATGVTILHVAEKMDAGDIILQRETAIEPEETAAGLEERLSRLGAGLMLEAMAQLEDGTAARRSQEDAKATTVHKLSKEDGRIDWTMSAAVIRNRIRGFQPWPGCFCEAPDGQRLKVLTACLETGAGVPGKVLDVAGEGPLVAAGEGALRLIKVQPAGRRAMDGAAYLRGHRLAPEARLG